MIIELNQLQKNKILQYAGQMYPQECCGFLIGKRCAKMKFVHEILCAQNHAAESKKNRRYFISPEDFMAAETAALSRGIEIIGIFHSHPETDAKPSFYDLQMALPVLSYLIVSLHNSNNFDLACWVLAENRKIFLPEEITGI